MLAREERIAQDDERTPRLRVRLDLRREDVRGEKLRRRGSVRRARKRERRGERGEPAPGRKRRRRHGFAEARLTVDENGSEESVRVEKARERPRVEPLRALGQQPEVILPAEHAVGEKGQPRALLYADELAQVAFDLPIDRLGTRSSAVEVARRLDERF